MIHKFAVLAAAISVSRATNLFARHFSSIFAPCYIYILIIFQSTFGPERVFEGLLAAPSTTSTLSASSTVSHVSILRRNPSLGGTVLGNKTFGAVDFGPWMLIVQSPSCLLCSLFFKEECLGRLDRTWRDEVCFAQCMVGICKSLCVSRKLCQNGFARFCEFKHVLDE